MDKELIKNGIYKSIYIWGRLLKKIRNQLFIDENYKYEVSVATIVKDEGLYLDEWIKYHHYIGIDHIYIFMIMILQTIVCKLQKNMLIRGGMLH
jgi:hypothetical protein